MQELISYSKHIKQTVALPCYGAKHIGWLTLESLCRQETTPYDWELIVCEEPHDKMLGIDFFYGYVNRLVQAGCNRIVYLSPDRWIPLAQKWRMIAQAAHPESVSFVKTDADDYQPKSRLMCAYKMTQGGYDWVDHIKGYFYSIRQKKLIVYDKTKMTNIFISFPTAQARRLPLSDKRRLVDRWLFKSMKPKNIYRVDGIYDSLNTDGENCISKREKYYVSPQPPFVATDKKITEIGLPKDITDRLMRL